MAIKVKKKTTKAPAGASAKGEAHVEKGGVASHSEKHEFPLMLTEGPHCNVNVNLGARIGLPDYSDVRIGASLTIPVDPTAEAIEEGFDFAFEWVETKMALLHKKVMGEEGE